MKKTANRKSAVLFCGLLMLLVIMAAMPAYAAKTGGWSVSKARYSFLKTSQKKIFDKAVKKEVGVSYKPVALLATQVVNGTNYVYLCQGTTSNAKATKAWYVLTANENTKGKVKLLSINKIGVGSIKTNENVRKGATDGGLKIKAVKDTPAALSRNVRKVFYKGIKKYVGNDLRPIALLGKQIVSGTNYRFLCYGTGEAGKDLFVVDICENLKGTCKVTACDPLNLEAYVG